MDYSFDARCWIWLSYIKGMSAKKFYRLLAEAESARDVYEQTNEFAYCCDEKTLSAINAAKADGSFDEIFEHMEKSGVSALTRADDSYPDCLARICDPPPTLFIKGDLKLDNEKQFAVVGTRGATYDGKKAAKEFTKVLVQNGATIISGLARGIDTCAHEACLDACGKTIAVLGNGLDSIYPPENTKLAQRILDCGGSLISEMRLDEAPSRYSFPQRNRIIAGLCEGALVVEGGKTSGSLITANICAEEGRDVFAIPGSIYNSLAEGPNSLIQAGAGCALSPWDIIEGMHWGARPSAKRSSQKPLELDEDEKKIYNLLKNEALSFDEIENLTGFSTSELNSRLTMLMLRSIIIRLPGNMYRLA